MKKDFSSMIENASPDEIEALIQSDVELDGGISSDKIKRRVRRKLNAGRFSNLRTSLAVAASLLLVATIGFASVVYMVGQKTVNPPADYTDVSDVASTNAEITTAVAVMPTEPTNISSTTVPTETAQSAEIVPTQTTEPTATTATTATEHFPIYDLQDIQTYEVRRADNKRRFQIFNFSSNISAYQDTHVTIYMYENGERKWERRFDGYYMETYREISDGILIALYMNTNIHQILKLDFEGNNIWSIGAKHLSRIQYTHVNDFYEYEDGSFAVFSGSYRSIYDEWSEVCLSHYSHDGELISYKNNHLDYDFLFDNLQFLYPLTSENKSVIRVENGFLIADLGHFYSGYHLKRVRYDIYTKFILIDDDGNIMKEYMLSYPEIDGVELVGKYTSKDEYMWEYETTGIIDYNGRVYISGFHWSCAPTGLSDKEKTYMGNADLNVENAFGVAMRKKMTGFILSMNYDGSDIEVLYSERGWQSGELHIDDNGNLVWDAEKIITFYYFKDNDPYIGVNQIYEYTFDPDGNLINVKETDRYTRLRA